MNKTIILFFGLILLSTAVFGQGRTQQMIDAGDNFFRNQQYHDAIYVYERVYHREDSPDIRRSMAFKLGESYRMLLNYQQAKEWYTNAMLSGHDDPIIYLHLSEMTLGLEEFDDAIVYAERFLENDPENERGLKMLESAEYSKDHYDRETIFEVTYEETLSSDGEEWGLAYLENYIIFYGEEEQAKYDAQFDIEINLNYNNIIYWARRFETPKLRIVFASTRLRDGYDIASAELGNSNIYQVMFNRQANDWDPPTPVRGGINSEYYDGFLTYDENNRIGYFMNCGGFRGERETCDIYSAEYNTNNDTWGEAKLFDYNSDEYNVGYPSINDAGDVLYFASDNPEGLGGYDLYKVYKNEDGIWDDPVNLGDVINTPYNDAYPFIARNVLYFSSFGHPGMGGFDIFYSIIDEEGNYSTPQNMGAPINSSADDFGFIINDQYSAGFFSSRRPGGSGSDDIYSFRVMTKSITLKGTITDAFTGEPMENLDFFLVGDDGSFYTVTSDNTGYYEVQDLSTDVNYEIEAFVEGYEDLREDLLVKDQLVSTRFEVITEYNYDIYLFPLEPPVEEVEEIEEIEEVEEVEEIAELVEEEEPAEPEPELEVVESIAEASEPEKLPVEEVVVEKTTPVTPDLPFEDYGLPTIYFDFAKSDLRTFSKNQLDSVVEYLKNKPDKGIIIRAHTDEVAGHLINFYLSQERAFSAMHYLIKKGIDEQRIYPSGYGKMDVIVKNAQTDYEHQLNRRANFEPIELSNLTQYINEASRHSFRYLNSIEKDVYFAKGIEFMVQFVATKNPVHPKFYDRIMREFPNADIIYYYDNDRFHRYLVGSFSNFTMAYNMMRELRKMDYDTYIVAFHNGERISVSLAQSLLNEN